MEIPETRYARTADAALAYQVLGDGPIDLIYLPQWVSNLEITWDNPLYARFLTRLASFSRLVLVDPRGTGLSDRMGGGHIPPPEVLMEDIGVVMDAVSSERAVLFGGANNAEICELFAATYPGRAAALVLYSAEPTSGPDEPYGWDDAEWERYVSALDAGWGMLQYARTDLKWVAPSIGGDVDQQRWWARLQRLAASPNEVVAIERHWREIDVRAVLPAIQVPTLVLHRTGDPVDDIEAGRATARLIPGAKFVELEGDDWLVWAGDQRAVLDEVESFVRSIGDEEARLDRVLATVLFTDIVGSTEKASELGDHVWRELLERHHATIRALLARFRGIEVDTAGDGFFATFDGPARGVRCAEAIVEAVHPLGLEVRAGLHTGEVETIDGGIGGIAVHIGARVGALAGASEILVSSTVKDLVAGSGLVFEDRGEHDLKGVPDAWRIYKVLTT